MDFFFGRDWLNRGLESYAFQWDHLLFIFLFVPLGVLLGFFLRKKDKKIVKIVMISLWAFSLTIEIIYYITLYSICANDPVNHPFVLQSMLPLHSCLAFMYVFPIAMFVKNKYIKTAANNFLVVVNMIMGFITLFVGCPSKGYSALSTNGLQSLIYHVIIVIVPLIMLITGYYDLQKGDLKYGLALFGILATATWIFDACTGCDYFYIYDGHTFGILYEISENVHHLVWTLIVGSCYVITAVIIHFSVLGIKYLINKKKKENNV